MPLAPGTRLGPYEITSSLGAGGMGEVYRATDTRLHRTVALKVLQGDAADDEFRARFQREAQAVAALNHPNVCVLHDVGRENSQDFLVMELLEGETLAERLRRGPLPIDQLLRYAVQIAEALAAAHRRGLVHRDLKPANIMLTPSGVKVLDFGLAKAITNSISSEVTGLMQTPPMTGRGTVLGTPGYIAPEQLLGRDADARSDIFALGAVLFEMATGTRPFSGDTQAAIIAAVLDRDPTGQLNDLPVPPLLKRLIEKSLAKDPEERWQHAADVAEALRWVADPLATSGPGPARRNARWSWVLTAAAASIAAIAIVLWLMNEKMPQGPALRASIVPMAGTNFTTRDITGTPHFAISPDGRAITFVAGAPFESPRLWLRHLDVAEARPLPGTDDAGGPFWSPDGTYVGFFARRRLKKISIADGTVQDLAEISFDVTGGAWSPEGVIVFGGQTSDGLYRISSTGGRIEPATTIDTARGHLGHRWPQFLPDGRSFLFYVRSSMPNVSGTYVMTPGDKSPRLVLQSRASSLYADPGYLLFDRNGTLMAQPFDVKSAQLKGEAIALNDKITGQPGPSQLPISASQTGTLAYWNGLGPLSRLEWYDRDGRILREAVDQGHFFSPELSPDGKRLLVTRRPSPQQNDLLVANLATRAWTRLTFSPGAARFGVWSPDGAEIVHSSLEPGGTRLLRKSSTGEGDPTVFLDTSVHWAAYPLAWSRDNRWLLYAATSTTAWDVWTVNVRDQTRRAVLKSPSNEVQAQLSPDGRWLAYADDEPGRWEVYVTSFPSAGGKWQVSTNGGAQPRWSADGKELFFLGLNGALMSVPVPVGSAFETTPPQRLFQTKALGTMTPFRYSYVVAANGEFLIGSVVGEAVEPITLVHNWTAGLRQGTRPQ